MKNRSDVAPILREQVLFLIHLLHHRLAGVQLVRKLVQVIIWHLLYFYELGWLHQLLHLGCMRLSEEILIALEIS